MMDEGMQELDDLGHDKRRLPDDDISIEQSIPPTTSSKTTRFTQDDSDRNRVSETSVEDQSEQEEDEEEDHVGLDRSSTTLPSTAPGRRRQRVAFSTPSSPISSPTRTAPPPGPLSPGAVSFQDQGNSNNGQGLKRASTGTKKRSRNSISSASPCGVRFQRGLGSESVGVKEDVGEDSESSYPTFASYRQAQHAHFDAFAQRMRRTLEVAAATAAAATDADTDTVTDAITEESSSMQLQ